MPKDRKQIILQSLAKLLEEKDATKITTAVLATESGITEAALYRHFPSKRSIYAELFSYCDDTVFAKCNELKKFSAAFFSVVQNKNPSFASGNT